MKRFVLTSLFTLFAATALMAQPPGASVEIVNESDWDIYEIYLSPSSEEEWGPEQLGEDDILESGESLTLTHIECAEYDILLIDEDGDECVITEQPLCQNDSIWRITNQELLSCQAFTE